MKKCLFIFLFVLSACMTALAQDMDSLSQLLQLPIENLMDIQIYSASKTEESVFDAPLGSYVITKEQIKRAGCTSIMEALRLAPGVIVREQNNGNYDIHLDGLDNTPPNSSLIFFSNSTTLVMIDDRPVYNYLHGGTFWETLPIDLNDVERIEIVHGPFAAMYGPNAVSGVINIITRRPENQGLYTVANAEYGSYHTLLANASLGYKFNKKVSAWATGNFQNRGRTQSDYYDIVPNRYVPLDSVTALRNAARTDTNIISRSYPHPDIAMRKTGVNGFVNYNPADAISFSLAIGAQHSEVQDEFGSGLMPFSTATSDTRYVDLKAALHDFSFHASHLDGTEAPVLGQKIWHWDLKTTDATADYTYKGVKNLVIRPAVYFRNADYDDSKYVNAASREGLWSGAAISRNTGVSLQLDYKTPNDKLRFIAAGRLDNFNYPVKNYLSYTLAATYKPNENNIFRLSGGRAYRTPLLIDLYSNLDLTGPYPLTNPSQTYLLQVRGNKNIRLLYSDRISLGYRTIIRSNMLADAEVFFTQAHDFSDIIFETGKFDSTGPVSFSGLIDFTNLSISVRQYGATFSLSYDQGKWQLRPFLTVQQSYLLDYSPYANSPQAPPLASNNFNPAVYNLYSNKGSKIEHQATPPWFGGLYINYKAGKKLNLNVNGYFYGAQTQLESDNLTYKDGTRGVQNINPALLLNCVVSYNLTKKLDIYGNFRNCLNNEQVEFYRGDAPAFMVFAGAHLEL